MRIILSILLLSFCYSQDCEELSLPNCNTSGDGMPCCAYTMVDNYICDGPDMPYGCDLSCYDEEAGPDWSYDCLCPDSCDDPNDGTWCGTWTDDCGTEHTCEPCVSGTLCHEPN